MALLRSLPDNAGPPNIFSSYPEIYRHWSEMSQELMNGPSPLTPGERELILAFAAGIANCAFVRVAHAEVAYEWGIADGLVDRLLEDIDSAPVDPRLRPLLAFVRKLAMGAEPLTPDGADAVLAAGWSEKALHDAIAITARMSFMQRLVDGYGFAPVSKEIARAHAKKRVSRDYVGLYRAFSKPMSP